ncbi:methyltransferase type 11 [Roseibium sp.]|uniref:methyltransferase type 11 n=1 Tax=Roseibium sp. TaxID=1936156 RepID=UPI003D0EF64F
MSSFAAQWLALREPLDLAARNAEVETAFLESLPARPLRILDLASGAGSTVAALSLRLPQKTSWLLTDHDPLLLEAAVGRFRDWGEGEVSTRRVDLAANLETLLLADVDAVTTSAFLDLTSEEFLVRLADFVAHSGKPFLASLTYDGRASFDPLNPFDEVLRKALNAHQQTDKGFGPALGPEAAERAIALFEERGCRVVHGRSDWKIASNSADFLLEFLSGWRRVGRETGQDEAALEGWWLDRKRKISDGMLNVLIGHVDFAVLPAD